MSATSNVQRFLGIRFAEAPVGELRWQPPRYVPDAAPLGTWAADCPQASSGPGRTRAPGQGEDCLFLNIWTPTTDPAAELPVLVWFYGGSFLFGSASDPSCDGAALAERGAVVVTAAYRVGLFGYLAHPALTAESAEGASGNYGLMDCLAALQWVRDNIASYGGDPARVTPFGVSAGSASLALLQTSPLANGLFQRLILQSPGAFRPLASLADAEDAALAAYGEDLSAMRAWSADEVLRQSAALVPKVRGLTSPRLLRPIRDGWVVVEDDRDAYRAGRFAAVPTLVGGNADEGTKLTAAWPIAKVAEYRELVAANFGASAGVALGLYPAVTDGDVPGAVAALFGDTQFSYGARGIARAVAARQPATYRYRYDYRPPGVGDGPHHGDEVTALFSGASPVGRAMGDAWLRFAANGDPNGAGPPDMPAWERYDSVKDNGLVFDSPLASGGGWRAEQLDFLDSYFG